MWGSLNDRLTRPIATYAQDYDQGTGQIRDKIATELLNESLARKEVPSLFWACQADKYLISALPS